MIVADVDTATLDDEQLAAVRRERFGFVFQSFGLLGVLTAAENVEVPLRIAALDPGSGIRGSPKRCASSGSRHRRRSAPQSFPAGSSSVSASPAAIVARPQILIADEPTGQLDSRTAAAIMALLVDLAHTRGIAVIVATHDPQLVAQADRVIELHDGRVIQGGNADAAADGAAESAASDSAPPASDPAPRTRAEARAAQHHPE